METQRNWNVLAHQERLRILKELNDDEVIGSYLPDGTSEGEFRKQLVADRRFWSLDNIGEPKTVDGVPTKETTIGAWRDLNRAEAILEFIDNSIDAWMRRRAKYPRQSARELLIFIDINDNILTYEDNAGGVEESKMINLVVPGHSETMESEHTIGSYRTGGKKAIFKLASEANIRTRYWNPVGTSDEAFEIHLDRNWLNDPRAYAFPYFQLNDKSVLQKGQTIYTFRLPPDLAIWDPDTVGMVTSEIRRNYTLLLLRHPEIKICFMNRAEPLGPLEDMYKFTGVHNEKQNVDIRPQKLLVKTQIERNGETYEVTVEIVLGCRTTTAEKRGNDVPGIDLYGNNRLFVHAEYDLFRDWYALPKGGARHFVRGYINIIGPNFLVPWDTHKRHLNAEREVVEFIRTNPIIKDFFARWRKVYMGLSASDEIKRLVPLQN
jgi:hypothetical protein